MSRRWHLAALLVAFGLQMVVLGAELVSAYYPLWVGQPIRLAVRPVDPRSLFRGNYVQLNLAIARVRVPAALRGHALREGETVYVSLRPNAAGVQQAVDVRLQAPAQGLYIKGWLKHAYGKTDSSDKLSIRYGIEAFFLPQKKARDMEHELARDKAVAKVMLAANGNAALVGLDTLGDSASPR